MPPSAPSPEPPPSPRAAALAALELGDPPGAWAALGFTVDPDGCVRLGGVELRLGGPGRGITAWAVTGWPELNLVPNTELPAGGPPESLEHPNGARALDHVVITVPDFDATARALEDAGLPFRRIRRAGPDRRQGFRRLGPAIMEVVEAPRTPAPAFWGLVVIVADLDGLAARLGSLLKPPRAAVQPGREIATLAGRAGLGTRLAFMNP